MTDTPTILLRFCLRPLTRYVLSWLSALVATVMCLGYSWFAFQSSERADGNNGHTTIDFGGQWLMGRMLVEGHGRHLYNRHYQRAVLTAGYPRQDEAPQQHQSDAEGLMSSTMGRDHPLANETMASFALPLASGDPLALTLTLAAEKQIWEPDPSYQAARAVALLAASEPLGAAVLVARSNQVWETERLKSDFSIPVGGPLYPPIKAFFDYPLGLIPPRTAYRVNQIANVLLAFVAGLGVCYLSQGRIWWPVATAVLIAFPGLGSSANLGQNAALTVTILIWGWALIARGRPGWGGVVWGLLAFKPVWAATFFLVPLLTRRWWVCLTMLATGAALATATLPFVGWQSWEHWLDVGSMASAVYNTDYNWIWLSRDLLSIPRRWMLDFSLPGRQRDKNWLPPALVGWCLVLFVLESTVRLAVLRRNQARAVDGPPAAFLFLAAWLCCFHFMYYDVVLAALPVFLLFTEPRRYLEPKFLAVLSLPAAALGDPVARYFQPALASAYPPSLPLLQAGYRNLLVVNRMVPTLVLLLFVPEYGFYWLNLPRHSTVPWETFVLLALWLWCGWLWLRGNALPWLVVSG